MDLLQLWQEICEETSDLAAAVERIPDKCECGDADAHLEGRCVCCDGHTANPHHNGSQNCLDMLSRLRADLTMLSQDFLVAGPALDAAGLETHRLELRRGVFLAAADLQAITEAFKRVSESVAGFRRDCAVARMQAIKRRCVELRDHCLRTNADLPQAADEIAKAGDAR